MPSWKGSLTSVARPVASDLDFGVWSICKWTTDLLSR
jgi:hypothetical protein